MSNLVTTTYGRCSCNRDTVAYYCDEIKCVNNKSQTLYCHLCSQRSANKHNHPLTTISEAVYAMHSRWCQLNKNVHAGIVKNSQVKAKFGKLLEILDRQCIEVLRIPETKSILRDFDLLKQFQ